MGLLRQRRARIPFSPQWVNALGPRSDGKRFIWFTEIGDNQFRWQVAEWDQWTRAGLVPGKHRHSTQVFVHDQRHPMIADMALPRRNLHNMNKVPPRKHEPLDLCAWQGLGLSPEPGSFRTCVMRLSREVAQNLSLGNTCSARLVHDHASC